jgi:hypothetical protein
VDSKPLADMSQSYNTSIVTTICKTDIEIASGIPDESGHPYHGIAASQMWQHFVSMRNINLQAAEVWMIAKWKQGIITKPMGIN